MPFASSLSVIGRHPANTNILRLYTIMAHNFLTTGSVAATEAKHRNELSTVLV